jgi:hypothetical protein
VAARAAVELTPVSRRSTVLPSTEQLQQIPEDLVQDALQFGIALAQQGAQDLSDIPYEYGHHGSEEDREEQDDPAGHGSNLRHQAEQRL